MTHERYRLLVYLYGAVSWAWLVTFPVAALAAVAAGWRPAAWILVGAMTIMLAVRFVVSVVTYRQVMNRPWPKVASLPDDDDW